jgi:hypothetical protein
MLKILIYLLFIFSLSLICYLNPAANGVVNQDRYWSILTGNQTDAVGYIGIKYPDDMSKMIYTVNRKFDDIKIANVTSEGKLFGTISVGGAIKEDLQDQLEGKSLSDFHELMVQGKLYVRVHTKDFPNGEISGNSFVGMHRLFPDDADIRWD